MTKTNTELCTFSILGISVTFALVGLLLYALVKPISPAQRIDMAFSTINQTITR